MKKAKFLSLIFLPLFLASCSTVEPNYISKEEMYNFLTTTEDQGYTKYSYEGHMNLFELEVEGLDIDRLNMDYVPENTSYYLSFPLRLASDKELFDEQFASMKNRFIAQDALNQDLYCYNNDLGGLSFKVFNSNKRLFFPKIDSLEVPAKWNAEIIYDSNGYLVSEDFSSINYPSGLDKDTVYGYCEYKFAK